MKRGQHVRLEDLRPPARFSVSNRNCRQAPSPWLRLMFPYHFLSSCFQSHHDTTQAVSGFWSSPGLNQTYEELGASPLIEDSLGRGEVCTRQLLGFLIVGRVHSKVSDRSGVVLIDNRRPTTGRLRQPVHSFRVLPALLLENGDSFPELAPLHNYSVCTLNAVCNKRGRNVASRKGSLLG